MPIVEAPVPMTGSSEFLSEDEIKGAVADCLRASGHAVEVKWGHAHGIDIDAKRSNKRIIIEAKGEVALNPQQKNYFVGAFGELVREMDDPDAAHGLALPDNAQYRNLVKKLPALAREKMKLRVFMVSRTVDGFDVIER